MKLQCVRVKVVVAGGEGVNVHLTLELNSSGLTQVDQFITDILCLIMKGDFIVTHQIKRGDVTASTNHNKNVDIFFF